MHHNRDSKKYHGFVNLPIYHRSTVIFPTLDDIDKAREEMFTPDTVSYGRRGNPTAFALENFLDNLEIFSMGASWGAFESLILPVCPQKLHSATQWNPRGTMLRVHAGLEDVNDLIADLDAGLQRYRSQK